MVKRNGAPSWGQLQPFEYGNTTNKNDTREAAMGRARDSISNWSMNYGPFADASFRIEEDQIVGGRVTRVTVG